MLSRIDRIKRLREQIQARDYEGVTTVLTGDIAEALIRDQWKLLKSALEGGIDEDWKKRAQALAEQDA